MTTNDDNSKPSFLRKNLTTSLQLIILSLHNELGIGAAKVLPHHFYEKLFRNTCRTLHVCATCGIYDHLGGENVSIGVMPKYITMNQYVASNHIKPYLSEIGQEKEKNAGIIYQIVFYLYLCTCNCHMFCLYCAITKIWTTTQTGDRLP